MRPRSNLTQLAGRSRYYPSWIHLLFYHAQHTVRSPIHQERRPCDLYCSPGKRMDVRENRRFHLGRILLSFQGPTVLVHDSSILRKWSNLVRPLVLVSTPSLCRSIFTHFLTCSTLSLAPVVQSLGYSPNKTQLMSVPPFAASAIGLSFSLMHYEHLLTIALFHAVSLIAAYVSDKYRQRGLTAALSSVIAVVGYAIFYGKMRTCRQL